MKNVQWNRDNWSWLLECRVEIIPSELVVMDRRVPRKRASTQPLAIPGVVLGLLCGPKERDLASHVLWSRADSQDLSHVGLRDRGLCWPQLHLICHILLLR